MPEDIKATSLPNAAAIAFLRNKQQVTTKHWDEMLGEVHAKSFTVAGAVKVALLNDLHEAVSHSIEQGQSIGEFRKAFDNIVAEHGWTYKGDRGWRTRIIYDTNMRAANQAAKWSRIQEAKALRPYLQYQTAGDQRVRQKHRDWDGTVLPIDHPWWDKHYPANGFGCRCGARSLSQRDLERKGLKVSDAPEVNLVERVNVKSGEVYSPTPEGVDVGFDYNVGKAWMAEDHLGRMMVKSPLPVQKQFNVVAEQLSTPLQKQFDIYSRALQEGIEPARKQIAVSYLQPEVITALPDIKTATVTITDDVLNTFYKKADVSREVTSVIEALPSEMASPKAVLKDLNGSLIYVLDPNVRSDVHLTDEEVSRSLVKITITPDAVRNMSVITLIEEFDKDRLAMALLFGTDLLLGGLE